MVVRIPNQEVFTTGEVAGILRISQQTVIRMFDDGELEGIRAGRGKFRKIFRESLVQWLIKQGISVEGVLNNTIVLVDEHLLLAEQLSNEWKVVRRSTHGLAMHAVGIHRPSHTIVSFRSVSLPNAEQYARDVREVDDPPRLIGICREMDFPESFKLLFDICCDEEHLADVLRREVA